MFNYKEKDLNRIETLIGEQCYIVGCVNISGLLKVDGSIEGDLLCEDDLILGVSGQIKGNVLCNNALIQGIVHGNISCRSTLNIDPCGNVKGDILVKKLTISEGGLLEGKCTMVSSHEVEVPNTNI